MSFLELLQIGLVVDCLVGAPVQSLFGAPVAPLVEALAQCQYPVENLLAPSVLQLGP